MTEASKVAFENGMPATYLVLSEVQPGQRCWLGIGMQPLRKTKRTKTVQHLLAAEFRMK
jgi:hypothetical protein